MAALIGRATERRQLRELVSGRVPVAVLGPAGIGKTLLARAAFRGQPSLTGTALAPLQWSQYLPLAQAVRASLTGDPDEVAAVVLAVADQRLLVIEDLQWADAGTRAVLDVLAQRLPIVVTVRTGPRGELEPATARWLDAMGAARLELAPLPRRAARAVIARRHSGLQARDVEQLLAAAGGNPLLLEQLPVLGVVSPTLRAALNLHLEGVPKRVRRDLLVLATAGHPLPAAVVAAAGDHPVTEALLKHRDGEVALSHASLGEVVLALASPAEHRDAHQALADHVDDAVLRAVHLLAAGHDTDAGRLASLTLVDEKDAARRAQLLRVVAESGVDPSGRARPDAAAALLDVGAWDDAVSVATAIEHDDPEGRAECHLVAALAHWAAGRRAEAGAELGTVARLVPATSPLAVRARVEAANQTGRSNPGPGAIAAAAAALAVAESAGVEQWRARSVLGQAMMFSGQPGWDDVLRNVMVEARDGDDEEAELSAAFTLASGLGFAGALVEAIELSRAVLARLADRPFSTWHAHFAGALVMNGMLTGDDRDEVIALSRRLLGERPLFRNRAQVDVALVVALADGGRADEAEAALRAARRVARGDEDRSLLLVAEAELGWAAGDGERVRRAAADADELEREWFGVAAVARALAAYASLDDGGPLSGRPPVPTMPALAATAIEHRALSAWANGEAGAALAGLDAAADAWDAVHLYRFAARARWAAAEVAVRVGDATARPRVQTARTVAADLALSGVLARADRTVEAASVPATTLTPREQEVLGLVAAGLTTPAIAVELGIGTATVESHLRSARQKLGARTRWQAATAFASLPRRPSTT